MHIINGLGIPVECIALNSYYLKALCFEKELSE